MEIRVLRYFLTVAREQSITGASEVLHITQPTLSRQLAQMDRRSALSYLNGARVKSLLPMREFYFAGVRRKFYSLSIKRKRN